MKQAQIILTIKQFTFSACLYLLYNTRNCDKSIESNNKYYLFNRDSFHFLSTLHISFPYIFTKPIKALGEVAIISKIGNLKFK